MPDIVDVLRMAVEGTIDAADLQLTLVTDDLDEAGRHLQRHAIDHVGLRSRRDLKPSRWLGEFPVPVCRRSAS